MTGFRESIVEAFKLSAFTAVLGWFLNKILKGEKMELVDKKLGSVGEIKVDNAVGVLSVELDASSPISISGVALGSVGGKLSLSISEIAMIDYLEAKYPNALFIGGAEIAKSVIKSL